MYALTLSTRTAAYTMDILSSNSERAKGAQAMKRARLLDFLSAASP